MPNTYPNVYTNMAEAVVYSGLVMTPLPPGAFLRFNHASEEDPNLWDGTVLSDPSGTLPVASDVQVTYGTGRWIQPSQVRFVHNVYDVGSVSSESCVDRIYFFTGAGATAVYAHECPNDSGRFHGALDEIPDNMYCWPWVAVRGECAYARQEPEPQPEPQPEPTTPVPPPRPANGGEPVITFGFEVETTARYGRSEVVRRLEAAGLRASEAYYSGSNYNVWQVKTDGSLHGRNAMEIVSPVLTFGTEDTERQVKALHDVLRDVGARANESCGLHVHMSVDHLNSTQLMDLIDFYHNRPRFWERVAGRGATRWCRRFNPDELDSLRTYAARGDWYDFSGATDRYRTINTAHYSNRGTLEFRQHDGATTYHEIMAWVSLLHGMVIAAGEDRLHELRCPNGTPVEDMVARFVEADLLQEDMRQWLLGDIPSERFNEVIAAAAPEVAEAVAESVARMLRLQGIDV